VAVDRAALVFELGCGSMSEPQPNMQACLKRTPQAKQ